MILYMASIGFFLYSTGFLEPMSHDWIETMLAAVISMLAAIYWEVRDR